MDRINTAVRAGPPVNDLVTRAGNGDKQAWDTLVERYAPLIWSICRRQRECGAIRRATRRSQALGRVPDAKHIPGQQTEMAEQELLTGERHAALHEAFTRLPPRCQRLIAVLMEDPPVPYAQISARLGIPIGSIGPSRRRCLDRLRRDPAIAALLDADAASTGGEPSRQVPMSNDDPWWRSRRTG